MNWQPYDTWIVVVSVLAAVNCALLGNFLLLRKLSMMGDAISHAVLPGLAMALWISGTVEPVSMLIGAAVVGVLTSLLVQSVSRGGKVDEGASMGVVFTSLFAIGLVMIRQIADTQHIDLDPDCVLFGQLAQAPLHTSNVFGWVVPRAAVVLGVMLILNTLFVGALFKELRITAFDPQLADTLGIKSGVMHYATMTLVAMTSVAAFESVGSILVVALLVAPPAAASLVANRLSTLVLLSVLLAIACGVLGHVLSTTVPEMIAPSLQTNGAGMTAVVAGLIFLAIMLLEPRRGVAARQVRRWKLALRIAEEDWLAHLWRQEEGGRSRDAAAAPAGGVIGRLARRRLQDTGRIRWSNDGPRLTDQGRRIARKLLRSHRLWERFMTQKVGIAPDHTHRTAESLEHVTDDAMREALATQAGGDVDPHGREIPK
ncbi:MAG: iron chelate uptake ABC transporter family permease subunit [Planctomycetota bacterium]